MSQLLKEKVTTFNYDSMYKALKGTHLEKRLKQTLNYLVFALIAFCGVLLLLVLTVGLFIFNVISDSQWVTVSMIAFIFVVITLFVLIFIVDNVNIITWSKYLSTLLFFMRI